MDYYNTSALIRVVENAPIPNTFLLDTFFKDEVRSPEEEIVFDVVNGKRRVAPFVSPIVAGKIVQSQGHKVSRFTPAYVKDKRALDPRRPLKRAVGERVGGGQSSPAEREAAIVVQEINDQVDMLTRRFELMAADALIDGKLTVVGEGYPSVVVDFDRPAGNSVALTSSARWGETGVSAVTSVEDWSMVALKSGGYPVTDIVFTLDSWRLFKADTGFKDAVSTLNRGTMTEAELISMAREGGQLMGKLGDAGPRLWVYAGWYVDDTDTEHDILPAYSVILGSDAPQCQGTRYFGTIVDPELSYPAIPYAPKSWIEKDPAQRLLLMQSAPLMVLTRPGASLYASVR